MRYDFTIRNPIIDKIIEIVCEDFYMEKEAVLGQSRKRELVITRQVIMLIAKEFTEASLVTIGSHLGRDYTTVIHGVEGITNLMFTDRVLKQKVLEAKNRVCMMIGKFEEPDDDFYSEILHCENWEGENKSKPLEEIEE